MSSKRIAYLRKATAQSAACILDLTCDSLHVFKKKRPISGPKEFFILKKNSIICCMHSYLTLDAKVYFEKVIFSINDKIHILHYASERVNFSVNDKIHTRSLSTLGRKNVSKSPAFDLVVTTKVLNPCLPPIAILSDFA